MIRAILFDTDGVVIIGPLFSERYLRDFKIPKESIQKLFQGDFQLCAVGKADLRDVLTKYLSDWQWDGTADSLIDYWLSEEQFNENVIQQVKNVRARGMRCYCVGNQEKYRARYLKEKYRLKDFFDGTFFSVDSGFLKPSTEYLNAVYEGVQKDIPNIEKEEIVLIDDEIKNTEAARTFGFLAKQYTIGDNPSEILKNI